MHKKTVLITGASGGIGYELAKLFAKNGYDLVLVARDRQRLEEIAGELSKEYRTQSQIIDIDLGQSSAPQKIYDQLSKTPIDVLINNAGFGLFGAFTETNWVKEQNMIQLNIMTLTELTKLFLPAMVARKSGRILNVASTAAFQPGPLMAVYYATKAYVLFFTEALAEELRGSGVFVTALCPGPTRSGFQKGAAMEKSKLVQGKMDEPAEVAKQGYLGLMRGKRVVITGFKNKMLALSIRFMPRALTTKAVMNAQKSIRA